MTSDRKSVRIFVSSTFKDMDVERDILRNYVVPLINTRLADSDIHAQLVDLRHSIETSDRQSEEEREKMIFDICMDEIKSCRPFFIGLVGHRYGWIPDRPAGDLKLPDGFPLAQDEVSVTVHEFLNGPILNENDAHALVFLRDKESYAGLSDSEKTTHIEAGDNAGRVEAFRAYLKSRPDIHTEDYSIDLSTPGSEEWENWGNHIAQLIIDLIMADNSGADAEKVGMEPFIKANVRFAESLSGQFKGREKLVSECIDYFRDRKSIYLCDTEPGMGSTSLLCRMYTELSRNPNYLCLFNAPDALPAANEYSEVLYHWNLQICAVLGRDKSSISEKRGDASAMFHAFCELAMEILEKEGRKVAVFTDRAYSMAEYFPIRQHFTLWAQTIEAGNKEVMRMLAATPVGEIDAHTFRLITAGLRNSVVEALWIKKSARNVKWLSLAVNILDSLNKIDYLEIRNNETKGNEERNITRYLQSIVEDMPDDFDDLVVFWIRRLRNVFGDSFTDTYLGSLAICHGLTDEDLANITGRSVAWCAWFRHRLDSSVLRFYDGTATINENLRYHILNDIADRKAVATRLYSYLSSLPADNPSRINNLFAVNIELCNYAELIAYISDKANYTEYVDDSPAVAAFIRMSESDTDAYIKLVEHLAATADPDNGSFTWLCRWCRSVVSNGKHRLFIHTCFILLNRLIERYNSGALQSDGQLSLASIFYLMGGSFVEVDDGEEEWDKANKNAMAICRQHINESTQWNALYTTVLYDRYEGFTQAEIRWKFLSAEFRPLADSDFNWLPTIDFASYMRLLRDMAILDARFDFKRDSSAYALKAFDVATAIWRGYVADGTFLTSHYNGMYEMLFCAMALARQCRETSHFDRATVRDILKTVLNQAFEAANKKTGFTSTAVMMATVTYLYAEMIVSEDAGAAVASIDRMIELLLYKDTPKSLDLDFMSKNEVDYLVLRENISRFDGKTDYQSIAFAWCMAARIVLDARLPEGVKQYSRYPIFADDVDKVAHLLECQNPNRWDRDLDPIFAVATAVYGKILAMVKIGKVPVEELKAYMNLFFKLDQDCGIHYRYADRFQYALICSLRDRIGIDLSDNNKEGDSDDEREAMTVDELEDLIRNEDYNTIIDTLGQVKKGTPTEIFYLALALLRTERAGYAAQYFKLLAGIDTDDQNLHTASVINLLFALLAAGNFDGFAKEYSELTPEFKEDSDIAMLHRAYKQATTRNDRRIELPTPYGFTL